MKKYLALLFVVTAFAAAAHAEGTEKCMQKCMKLVKEKARCACVCDNECEGVEPIRRDQEGPGKPENVVPPKRDQTTR